MLRQSGSAAKLAVRAAGEQGRAQKLGSAGSRSRSAAAAAMPFIVAQASEATRLQKKLLSAHHALLTQHKAQLQQRELVALWRARCRGEKLDAAERKQRERQEVGRQAAAGSWQGSSSAGQQAQHRRPGAAASATAGWWLAGGRLAS